MESAVGRYALFGEIAAGGMATVYYGRLLGAGGFSRTVAIKRLHPHYAKNAEFVAMFLDEARLAARIQHPNVVPTLDVVVNGGDVLLVLEYVHGESLASLHLSTRKRGDLVAPPIALAVLAGALHGLHAAHDAKSERGEPLGIVHRDVSPQNILVGADGIPRILDFGVAKAKGRLQATREGQLKGKLAYMAPEQLHDGPVDRRTDVYAAGVVLWEILCGRRLFHGDSEAAVVTKVLSGEVPPPSKIVPGVPPELDAIALRAIARDKETRFQTARDMALAIEACGALAMPSQVGSWVQAAAAQALEKRAEAIADVERHTSPRGALEARDLVEKLGSLPPAPTIAHGSPPQHSSPQFTNAGVTRPRTPAARSGSRRTLTIALASTAALVAFAGLGARVVFSSDTPAPGAGPPALAASRSTCSPGMLAIAAGSPALAGGEPVGVRPFCIDATEVTTGDYKACADSGACRAPGKRNEGPTITPRERDVLDPLCNIRAPEDRGTHPINCVSFEMAASYCQAKGKRLPTEPEWQLAALGEGAREYPWGNEPPDPTRANACGRECAEWGKRSKVDEEELYAESDGWPTTAPVGSFPAGKAASGALDMYGNVWEWVDAPGRREDQRVLRGGAWNASSLSASATRIAESAERRSYSIGFRCARDAAITDSGGTR